MFRQEKRREDRMRGHGVRFLRVANDDLGSPWPRVVDRLSGLLATRFVGPRRFRVVRRPEPGALDAA